MEPSTVAPSAQGTGSATIADMMGLAAERFADRVAARRKVDGEWRDTTYAQAGTIVSEIARGLIGLGLQPGERVAILCTTRPSGRTRASRSPARAASWSPSTRPTPPRSAATWRRTPARASSSARTASSSPRSPPCAGSCPRWRPSSRSSRPPATPPSPSPTCASAAAPATPARSPRARRRSAPRTLLSVDLGASVAYFGGDTRQIVPELMEVRPHYMPSVPRIFEKIYTLVTSSGDPERIRAATQLGLEVRALQAAGEPVPDELQAAFDQADAELFSNVRNVFGGRLKRANTGAAPIAKEILEFFYAAGVPVLEGYGMTETSTVSTTQTVEHHKFGTVGRALPGCEVRIAASESGDEGEARGSGEVLIRGPHIFTGYHGRQDESFGAVVDGWLHTGDLGSLDEDGYLTITGRKKDIIITAGGKNLTPANLENDLKQSRWISHAVMYGDRRPYPVALITLDPEEIVAFARERGLPEDVAALSRDPQVHELIQGVLDQVNARYARAEQIKRFAILDHDLSQETGELTPTLKVKRNVVNEKYADVFEALY